MLNHLLDAVEQMRFTSYGEAEIAIGVPAHFQGQVLTYIWKHVLQPMFLPDITVLMLRKDTKRPGWFEDHRSIPLELARAEAYWQMEVGRTFGDYRLPAMRDLMQAQLSKVL